MVAVSGVETVLGPDLSSERRLKQFKRFWAQTFTLRHGFNGLSGVGP